jgi:hypothetical protein
MAVRDRSAASLAPSGTTVHPGHLRRGSTFVDEHQPLGIQIRLGFEPSFAPCRYVRAVLFGGMRRLFFRVTLWR